MSDEFALLARDEPAPARLLNEAGKSDFVLTADHAGRAVPHRLGTLSLPPHELARHIAWDIGIAGVTERLAAALDAPAIMQAYSRLVIDCNRPLDVDSSIPRISETTEIPGNRDISPDERAARRREIFAPYHEHIRAVLEQRERSGRRSVLVAMHSFTPVYKGEQRAVQAGVLYNRDPRLARILLDLLRGEGDLIVGDNAPYAVSDATDYTVPTHGEQRGLPHVELEIRQDLIAGEAGQAEWATRLARLLPQADARLRAKLSPQRSHANERA